jgi:hypothetical protein
VDVTDIEEIEPVLKKADPRGGSTAARKESRSATVSGSVPDSGPAAASSGSSASGAGPLSATVSGSVLGPAPIAVVPAPWRPAPTPKARPPVVAKLPPPRKSSNPFLLIKNESSSSDDEPDSGEESLVVGRNIEAEAGVWALIGKEDDDDIRIYGDWWLAYMHNGLYWRFSRIASIDMEQARAIVRAGTMVVPAFTDDVATAMA